MNRSVGRPSARLTPALITALVLGFGCSDPEPPAERFVANSPGWLQMEALHAAASYGDLEATGKLLRRGVHVDARNYMDETPLMSAISNARLAAAELLIENGADVNAESFVKMTPLMIAARLDDARFVRALIDAGAAVDTLGERGFTALTHAAAKGRVETAVALLEAGADPSGGGPLASSTPVELARQRGSAELVGLLVSAGADRQPARAARRSSSTGSSTRRPRPASSQGAPDEPGLLDRYDTALIDAAISGDVWAVREALDTGEYTTIDSENPKGLTALGIAVKAKNTEMVQVLLDAGAWVDHPQGAPTVTPLVLAVRAGSRNYEVTRLLLDAGANPDVQPLLAASAPRGMRRVCMALIEAGADVNLTQSDGSSALIGAAALCDVELMEALIFAGADVNYVNQYGSTALKVAKRRSTSKCQAASELLLTYGAVEKR